MNKDIKLSGIFYEINLETFQIFKQLQNFLLSCTVQYLIIVLGSGDGEFEYLYDVLKAVPKIRAICLDGFIEHFEKFVNIIRINFPEHILIVGYTSGILKPQTWVREAQDTTNTPVSTWVREPKKVKIDPIEESKKAKIDRIEEFFSRIKNKPSTIANVPTPSEKPKSQHIIRKEGNKGQLILEDFFLVFNSSKK